MRAGSIADGLPEVCYVFEPHLGLVAIKRGEKGYYPVKDYPNADAALADRLNERLGVTSAQRRAMQAGSIFRWDIPAADPKIYEGK